MKKPFRYILYVLVGVLIYFFIGANDDPTVLKEFNSIAPMLIIGVVVLLFIVRYILSKQQNNDQDRK